MYEKDFDIYKKQLGNTDYSKNFYNLNKLNKAGRMVYNAFQVMQKIPGQQNLNEDFYFENIEQIHITSQQRKPEQDKYVNSHTRDMAVDFWIKPLWLMPYYAGRLFRSYGNNIYISIENGHIHFDIDADKGKGLRFQSSVMVETETTKVDGHIFPVKDKLNEVLSFYGVNTISIRRKAAGIETETRKMLLDLSPIRPYIGSAQSKLDQVIEKKIESIPSLKAAGSAFNFFSENKKAVFFGLIMLALVVVAIKYIPTQLQESLMQKLKDLNSSAEIQSRLGNL